MKASLKWLNKYVDLDGVSVDEIAEALPPVRENAFAVRHSRRNEQNVAGEEIELLTGKAELAPAVGLKEKFRFEVVEEAGAVFPESFAAREQHADLTRLKPLPEFPERIDEIDCFATHEIMTFQ